MRFALRRVRLTSITLERQDAVVVRSAAPQHGGGRHQLRLRLNDREMARHRTRPADAIVAGVDERTYSGASLFQCVLRGTIALAGNPSSSAGAAARAQDPALGDTQCRTPRLQRARSWSRHHGNRAAEMTAVLACMSARGFLVARRASRGFQLGFRQRLPFGAAAS